MRARGASSEDVEIWSLSIWGCAAPFKTSQAFFTLGGYIGDCGVEVLRCSIIRKIAARVVYKIFQ